MNLASFYHPLFVKINFVKGTFYEIIISLLKLRTAKNLNFFGEINVETKILKNQFFRTF